MATPVIVGALLFLCVVAAVALAAAFYAWRWTRRKLLMVRVAWRNVERGLLATRPGRSVMHHLVRDQPASSSDVLWQAVDQAETAVTAAMAAGAPVGDLPSLCRRLRATATALDGLPADDGVRRQVADVVATAGTIQSAATTATTAVVTGDQLRDLVADTDREVASLAAGTDRFARHRG